MSTPTKFIQELKEGGTGAGECSVPFYLHEKGWIESEEDLKRALGELKETNYPNTSMADTSAW